MNYDFGAHIRVRYVTPLIESGLRFKGLVGVFGHRQVGKTTLLEQLSRRYTTLDVSRELQRADSNPELFLQELSRNPKEWPTGIDECQSSPVLFPALKEFVRVHKNPGIFLLSGSVRFSSRKAIAESLAGRILTYELLPFSISELAQKPINTLASNLIGQNFRSFKFPQVKCVGFEKHTAAQKYLKLGGLPGICFVRNELDSSVPPKASHPFLRSEARRVSKHTT